jgi:hypothetical protein
MATDPRRSAVVAFVWDFDRTLILGDQQETLFAEYGIDGAAFWAEVEALPEFHRRYGEIVPRDTAYLLHLLSYVEAGALPGLDNARLAELGARLRPSPGIPGFLEEARRRAAVHPGLTLEHYAISTGLRPMVEGSPVAPFLDGIWANTFVEHTAPPGFLAGVAPAPGAGRLLRQGLVVDDTSKTRALFEINKGANRIPGVDVHDPMPEERRRVPFGNIVYVADGHSDVPVFSLLNERGGHTLGVYQSGPNGNLPRVQGLLAAGRIQAMAEADFRPGSPAHTWLVRCLDEVVARAH